MDDAPRMLGTVLKLTLHGTGVSSFPRNRADANYRNNDRPCRNRIGHIVTFIVQTLFHSLNEHFKKILKIIIDYYLLIWKNILSHKSLEFISKHNTNRQVRTLYLFRFLVQKFQ